MMAQVDLIAEYIEENLELFCGPGGLGLRRPGTLPEYYANNLLVWRLDRKRVEALRKTAGVQDGPKSRNAAAIRSSMSADTRDLLNHIRDLWQSGHREGDIAVRLSVPERCVRNAVALGDRADSPEAQAPDHGPDVGRFLKEYASWPAGGAR